MDKKNQFLYVKRLLNGFRGRNKARVFFFTSVDYKMSRYENVDLKINYIKKKKQLFFKRVATSFASSLETIFE